MTLDPTIQQELLRQTLTSKNLLPVWDLAKEHGRRVFALPFDPPDQVPKPRGSWGGARLGSTYPSLIFEIPSIDDAVISASKSLAGFASLLGLDTLFLRKKRLWLVYQNDGNPPFNPGAGSDQGPTAFLGIYMTFEDQLKGLTKLGWTVIDMRTPRGTLAPGEPFGSGSQYQTPSGPYSGISSLDFEVTVHKTGTLTVIVKGAAGIDSTRWGKFVQDTIHKNLSNSPLFPWPDNPTKLFAQGGAAALVTPQKVLTSGEVLSLKYTGKIEFGGELTTGTHRTEVTADARLVLRTTAVDTPLGSLSVEYSPLGFFGRGFVRYNDGRPQSNLGVEGGAKANAMIRLGRLGIGLAGEITVSTDPSLQTGNPAGTGPVLNPLSAPVGSDLKLGGPAGFHGTGQLVLTWSF